MYKIKSFAPPFLIAALSCAVLFGFLPISQSPTFQTFDGGALSRPIDISGESIFDSEDFISIGSEARCSSSYGLGVGGTVICGAVEFRGAVYFVDAGSRPGCSAANVGQLFFNTTTAEMCMSNGSGGYTWVGFGSIGGGAGDALTSNSLAQFAATTSAELSGVLSDEQGTGAFVLASEIANKTNWDTAYTQRIQSVTVPVTFASGVLAVGYDNQSVVLNGSNQLTTAQDIRTTASPTFANTTLSANGVINGTLSVGLGSAASRGIRIAHNDTSTTAGVNITQAGTGDVALNFGLPTDSKAFALGVRNSNDTFRISAKTSSSSATLDPTDSSVLFTMTTTGTTTFTDSVTASALVAPTISSASGTLTIASNASFSSTIALADPGTKPTCDSSQQGKIFRDASTTDTVEICSQVTSGVFGWRNMISQGTSYTFGDGVNADGSNVVSVDYNTTNLKITSNQLNTIQNIAPTSSVTFGDVTTDVFTLVDNAAKTRPACTVSNRGMIWTRFLGAAENDFTSQCMKSSSGNYNWYRVVSGAGTTANLGGAPDAPTAGMVAIYTGGGTEDVQFATSTVSISGDDISLAAGGKVDGIDISARFDNKSYKSDASITFHHVAVGGDDNYGSLRGTTVDGDELALLVWDVDDSAHVKWARAINADTPTVDLNTIVTHNEQTIAHNENGIDSLTSAEVDQLENIGTSAISATEWGYVAGMDQGVATTNNVTFGQVIVDNVRINGSTIIAQSGNVGISGQNPTDKVQVQSELELNYMPQLITPISSKPDCDADSRGKIWRVTGGSGAADSTEFCDKKADGSYAWQTHLKSSDLGVAGTSNLIGETKYVVAPSGAPYTSIQTAIDACVAAETETYDAPCLIKILPGSYTENITLAASVVLEGASDGILPSISGVITADYGNNSSGPYNVSSSLKNLRINSQTGAYAIDFTGTTAQSLWLYNVRIYKGSGTGKGIRVNNSGSSTVGSFTSVVYIDDLYVQGASTNSTACIEHSAGRINVRGNVRLENPTLAATWVSTGSAVAWQTSGNIYAEGKFTFASSGLNTLTNIAMSVLSTDRCINNTGAGTLVLGQFGCSAVSSNAGAMIDASAGAIVYSRGTSAGLNFASVITGAGAIAATDVLGTLFQPLDSDLTSIAGVSTTSFGRGFLSLADQAAAQSYIGASGGGTSYTFGDGVNVDGSNVVSVDYNTTNLQITSAKINTIQNIATTSTPTFAGETLAINDTSTTPHLALTQASTGDSALKFSLGSTRSYAVGIDNSASDSFKISTAASASAVLGTSDLLTLDTNGNLTLAGTLTSVGSTTFDQIVVDSLTLNNTSLTSSNALTLGTGSSQTLTLDLPGTGTVEIGSVMRITESGSSFSFGANTAPQAKFWFITDGSSSIDLQGANAITLFPNGINYNSTSNKAGYGMRGEYNTSEEYATFGGLSVGKLNTNNADSKGVVKLVVGPGSTTTGDVTNVTAALTCQGTGSGVSCSQVATNFTGNVTLDSGITVDGYDVGAVLGSLGSTYQPLDASLTALAGVATAANKLSYWSGTDTITTIDFTAAGRSLASAADASAQRTALALSSTNDVTFNTVSTSKITMSDSGTKGTCDAGAVGEVFLETSGDTDTFEVCLETTEEDYNWTDLVASGGGGGGGGTYTAGAGLVLSGTEFSLDSTYSATFGGLDVNTGDLIFTPNFGAHDPEYPGSAPGDVTKLNARGLAIGADYVGFSGTYTATQSGIAVSHGRDGQPALMLKNSGATDGVAIYVEAGKTIVPSIQLNGTDLSTTLASLDTRLDSLEGGGGGGGGGGSYTAGDGLVLSSGEFSLDPTYTPEFNGIRMTNGSVLRTTNTTSLHGFTVEAYDTDDHGWQPMIEILNADDPVLNLSQYTRLNSYELALKQANNAFLDITTTRMEADNIYIDGNSINQSSTDMVFNVPTGSSFFFYGNDTGSLYAASTMDGHGINIIAHSSTTLGDAAMRFQNQADERGYIAGINGQTGRWELDGGNHNILLGAATPLLAVDEPNSLIVFGVKGYIPQLLVGPSPTGNGDLRIRQASDANTKGLVITDTDESTSMRMYITSSNLFTFTDGTDDLMTMNATTDVVKTTKKFVQNSANVTVASSATTFALTGNVQNVTCDSLGNNVATITGGFSGMEIILLFANGVCTLVEDESTSADTLDLQGGSNYAVPAGAVVKLVHINGYWHEVSRSAN